jgi:hypothetical protein
VNRHPLLQFLLEYEVMGLSVDRNTRARFGGRDMAELKTKKSAANVETFLAGVKDAAKREDCKTLVKMMSKAAKADPKMWGPAIIGFGDLHLVYDSGRELDWFPIGFSPRKEALTIYMSGGLEPHTASLKKLGKYKTGKGCLYIKALSDVDAAVLGSMFDKCVKGAKSTK